jgi:hypothetical protein
LKLKVSIKNSRGKTIINLCMYRFLQSNIAAIKSFH